jgi:hypothetical protein
MSRARIISEVNSAEDAKKVEETVKTGYAEPMIESVLTWIGVEEDLAGSYDALAKGAHTGSASEVYQNLAEESRRCLDALEAIRRSLEKLDETQVKRIGLLKKPK